MKIKRVPGRTCSEQLQDAAEKGNHPKAQYHLGVAYRDGVGAQKKVETAVVWFTLSAEQVMPFAMCIMK